MKVSRTTILFLTAGALATVTQSATAESASFKGLGDLPGGEFYSSALRISPDGNVVVGFGVSSGTSADGREAFRWTEAEGMVPLGDLPGADMYSEAWAASTNGNVIVGSGNGPFGWEAFRWTSTGGMEGLGDLPGGVFNSGAFGVSADGSVIVGVGDYTDGDSEAFRWTATDGLVGLGDLPGGRRSSFANDVSDSGNVITGYAYGENFLEAFRWTEATGMVGLGHVNENSLYSLALAISGDGSTIVGYSWFHTTNVEQAFRWTPTDGMVSLGDVPFDGFSSRAEEVSSDGKIVVGWFHNDDFTSSAFIWDETNGMRKLQDVLVDDLGLGTALEGWSLETANGISSDGTRIVGRARNPAGEREAFLAVVPRLMPARFIGLGDLPGGTFFSKAAAVSDDGSTVVGSSVSDPREFLEPPEEAFRWTEEEGMIGLGIIPGHQFAQSLATDVSADGSVVVGFSHGIPDDLLAGGTYQPIDPVSFRWTREEGMVGLDPPANNTFDDDNYGEGVSNDGTVIVGFQGHLSPSNPYRWTAETGMEALIDSDEYILGVAYGISGDGSVVVGANSKTEESFIHAYRWTAATGATRLGYAAGDWVGSRAIDVSDDGTVVVGDGGLRDGSGTIYSQAVRWTTSGGMQNLSTDPNINSVAGAVSADGRVVVGKQQYFGIDDEAFIWTANDGMRSLKEVLIDDYGLGVAVGDWVLLNEATGISSDGRVIVGFGLNAQRQTEAFLAYLGTPVTPEPPFIVASPATTRADAGGSVTHSVDVIGVNLSYQWQFNGENINGATESSYTLPSAQKFQEGSYTVVVSNPYGSVTSTAAVLSVDPVETFNARPLSLSTRGFVGTGDRVMISGFVIQGTGTKRLMLRAAGPTLEKSPFNLGGVLADPQIDLQRLNPATQQYEYFDYNNNWGDNSYASSVPPTAAELYAFELTDPLDSTLILDAPPGQYTVIASDVDRSTGVSIVEVYDADGGSASAVMTSISTRGYAGPGNAVMIPGFVISSDGPTSILIRAVGPTLSQAPYNVSDAMVDPVLTVFRRETNGTETQLFSNDNWSESPDSANTATVAEQVFAFPLSDGSKDAAVVAKLQPGVYTVVGSENGGDGWGVAIVEVYFVPQPQSTVENGSSPTQ